MIVKIQNHGRLITGIRIAASDARRFFPQGSKCVELELDHLRIRCDLQASFWLDRPEISDARMCGWLEEQFFGLKLPATPTSLEMVKTGNAYRLQPLPTRQQLKRIGFGLTV